MDGIKPSGRTQGFGTSLITHFIRSLLLLCTIIALYYYTLGLYYIVSTDNITTACRLGSHSVLIGASGELLIHPLGLPEPDLGTAERLLVAGLGEIVHPVAAERPIRELPVVLAARPVLVRCPRVSVRLRSRWRRRPPRHSLRTHAASLAQWPLWALMCPFWSVPKWQQKTSWPAARQLSKVLPSSWWEFRTTI